MFTDLKPYSDHRQTDRSALTAPSHWGVQAMRTLLRSRSERNRPDLPLLSVARERGVFVRTADDDNHNVIPEDLSNYKIARIGDLVVNKMKAWQGSLGLAPCDGVVSPAYFVFDFDIADRFYGQALLRSKPYVALFAAASDGVRIGQWDLVPARMREIPVLLPPPDEQAAIVRYLAHANRRIDKAIAAKRKLIRLLEEQNRVIVNLAVTRGLDPDAPTKDSDVPGLGMIPSHWDVSRIRSFARERDERAGSAQEDLALLSVSISTGVTPRRDITQRDSRAADFVSYKVCYPGDLALNRMRAFQGAIGVSCETGMVSPDYLVSQIDYTLVRRPFLELAVRANYFIGAMTRALRGIGAVEQGTSRTPRINPRDFFRLPIAMPPIQEQGRIVEHLRSATALTSRTISQARAEVDLVREFRTRLTADVVTGQVDVRAIAATLPDVELDELVNGPDESVDEPLDDEASEYLEEA